MRALQQHKRPWGKENFPILSLVFTPLIILPFFPVFGNPSLRGNGKHVSNWVNGLCGMDFAFLTGVRQHDKIVTYHTKHNNPWDKNPTIKS